MSSCIRTRTGKVQRVIYRHFGLSYPDPQWLHDLDWKALRTEQRDLMQRESDDACFPSHINPWSPKFARSQFHNVWRVVCG